jgi:hypothetical protein
MSPTVPGGINWQDGAGGGTPLDAVELNAEEAALAAYTDQLRADVASGAAPLPASVASKRVPTSVKSSGTYAAAVGDLVLVDLSTANVTITLPPAPADLAEVEWKIIKQTGSFALTINAAGSDVFIAAGGAATQTGKLADQGKVYQYQHSTGIWIPHEGDLSLGQLDLRYDSSSTINVSATGNCSATSHTEFADATAGGFTRTLPTPVGSAGMKITIDAITTGVNLVTVATAAGTIDGAATLNLGTQASGAPYKCAEFRSDGTIWRIV